MADFRLRVTYKKAGRLCMLSHLELCRALERSVRRAGLPYAVSQGFSPHMKLAFGAALPVGVGGDGEIYDVNLTDYVDPDEALRMLQKTSASNLMPYEAHYITKEDKAASVAYPVSTYEALFDGDASQCVVPETVTVIRKKKEKVLQVSDYLIGEPIFDDSRVTFTLQALPSGSLRPDVFVPAMCPENLHVLNIVRTAQREEV